MRGFNEFECEPSEVHLSLQCYFFTQPYTAWGALDQSKNGLADVHNSFSS
jgi:hypothetical protein